jgi:hypothetical protein
METAEIAIARELPGDEQRRSQTVNSILHANLRQLSSTMPTVNNATATT